jgi:hypothetical protein
MTTKTIKAWAVVDDEDLFRIPICKIRNVRRKGRNYKPWAIFGEEEMAKTCQKYGTPKGYGTKVVQIEIKIVDLKTKTL